MFFFLINRLSLSSQSPTRPLWCRVSVVCSVAKSHVLCLCTRRATREKFASCGYANAWDASRWSNSSARCGIALGLRRHEGKMALRSMHWPFVWGLLHTLRILCCPRAVAVAAQMKRQGVCHDCRALVGGTAFVVRDSCWFRCYEGISS